MESASHEAQQVAAPDPGIRGQDVVAEEEPEEEKAEAEMVDDE